jgi:hypothetical protein
MKSNIDMIRESLVEYRVATPDERELFGVCEYYELLIGPEGFTCVLTEPEDRTFFRDLKSIVYELNRLKKALSTIAPDAIRQKESQVLTEDEYLTECDAFGRIPTNKESK